MKENYLSEQAYAFYQEFKKMQNEGKVSEVIFGSKNRKITVKNGSRIIHFEGDETPILAKRIYRNVSNV